MIVFSAVAVPGKLDTNTAVFVAMDFFARRAADNGMLITVDRGFGVGKRRSVWRVPRCGEKGVAIALGQFVVRGTYDRRFERLRLLAGVDDFGQ